MNISLKNLGNKKRDVFILSNGHTVAALYSILCQKKIINRTILKTYCQNGSLIGGHPTFGRIPGIETTTGSLGHGLPMGMGMALAKKKSGFGGKVYVMISDGEMDEGSVWETALAAPHFRLDNLIVIACDNNSQGYGKSREVLNLDPIEKKWQAFGWKVKEVNGHDTRQILQELQNLPPQTKKPTIIIAKTILGKGVSFMENKMEWHYLNLDEKLYKIAKKEIEK